MGIFTANNAVYFPRVADLYIYHSIHFLRDQPSSRDKLYSCKCILLHIMIMGVIFNISKVENDNRKFI